MEQLLNKDKTSTYTISTKLNFINEIKKNSLYSILDYLSFFRSEKLVKETKNKKLTIYFYHNKMKKDIYNFKLYKSIEDVHSKIISCLMLFQINDRAYDYNYNINMNNTKTLLATGSWDKRILIWELKRGINNVNEIVHERIMEMAGHKYPIRCLTHFKAFNLINKDNNINDIKDKYKLIKNYLLSGSKDCNIILWNVDDYNIENSTDSKEFYKTSIKTFTGHSEVVTALVVISLKGKINSYDNCGSCNSIDIMDSFISSSEDKSYKVWDLYIGTCTKTIYAHNGYVTCINIIYFDKTNFNLLTGGGDKVINIWDNNFNLKTSFSDHLDKISCITNITTNTTNSTTPKKILKELFILSSSDDKTIRKWDINTLQCFFVLDQHEDRVFYLDLINCYNTNNFNTNNDNYENNKLLISGSRDNNIRFWNIKFGFCLKSFYIEYSFNCAVIFKLTDDYVTLLLTNENNIDIYNTEVILKTEKKLIKSVIKDEIKLMAAM